MPNNGKTGAKLPIIILWGGDWWLQTRPDLDCLHNSRYWKIKISLIKMQVSASLSDRESPGNVRLALLLSNSWNWATVPRKDEAHLVHVLWSVPRGLFTHSQSGPGPQRHLHLRPPLERKNHIEMIYYTSLSHLQPTRGQRKSYSSLYSKCKVLNIVGVWNVFIKQNGGFLKKRENWKSHNIPNWLSNREKINDAPNVMVGTRIMSLGYCFLLNSSLPVVSKDIVMTGSYIQGGPAAWTP